jgi:light-regulated signal transduction histidine kinase (bacteriophytochrome)/HAMP domain-containing protein
MEYVNKNTQITLILCIAALIVAMIIGTWTASWIIKPILQLNTAAKDIAQGNWDNTLKVERSDELGELAVSFNSMASQLQKSFVEMEELNIKLKEVNHTLESRVHERTAELKAVNEELEAFSYSVSHDLQAPLRKIDSFSQIILARYGDNLEESAKSYFDRLRSNTQRMSEIINDLLTLSRVNRNQMQVSLVNVSAIVKEITDNLQENQPERQVEWIIAPEVIINCDASLMKMVLENLLNNAWKFTSSQIYPRIEFNTILQEDGKVVYFIRDNGAGFDMTHVNQLFKAFARLHSTDEFPGTGIGLAIVQRVIKRHGGEIWAEGEIGGGATFYFTL